VNNIKQFEKNMVAFRLHPDLHRKMKLLCLEKNITMQDFLSDIVEKELKET